MHAPPGTGVAEVFGNLVAAIVTERARRIADLPDPAAAFAATAHLGRAHGRRAVRGAGRLRDRAFRARGDGPAARGGLALPPIGTRWRDRAARADYFASTARLSNGVGAWAMLAARLGDRAANRAFAERWWHGAVRGTDVLFPAGESMTAALRQLKGKPVDWPAAVAWFRSALAKAESLAAERMRVAAALTCLSGLELACEEASCAAEAAQARLAELTAREPAAREVVSAAEEEYRASLAALGAHQLARPALTTVTQQGVAALHSRGALSVVLAGGVRRGRNLRDWSVARRELRAACAVAEQRLNAALRDAEALRGQATAARSAASAGIAEVARLAAEMAPLAEAVTAARQRWGDHVPAGPSQAETEDPALIEWRETMAPWADEEYAHARAQVFVAALELHKALIAARAEVFEANLAALMELISADHGSAGSARPGSRRPAARRPAARRPGPGRHRARRCPARRVALVLPRGAGRPRSVRGGGLALRRARSRRARLAACRRRRPARRRRRARPDALVRPRRLRRRHHRRGHRRRELPATAQHLADGMVRYGTWLPAGPPDAEPRWVGMPLRVVRGQDRTTVDRRNDLAYDGLLIAGQE